MPRGADGSRAPYTTLNGHGQPRLA